MSSRSDARAREDRVVELRLKGWDFDRIARELGFRDRSGAWKAYRRALSRKAVPVSKTDNVREDEVNLELARLDELQSKIWDQANRGDLAAVDRVLKIMDRRDKLKHRYHVAGAALPTKGDGKEPEGGVVVGPDILDRLREERRAGGA